MKLYNIQFAMERGFPHRLPIQTLTVPDIA
jgi:hypothetical protein